MSFKIRKVSGSCPDNPEALLRDLRKRTIPGLLSHQADVIRQYVDKFQDSDDVAFQLPTGSGKTLVGLLIAEWLRRKHGHRVVYLCPTKQLANQVADQAEKYGIDLKTFVGQQKNYDPKHKTSWQSADCIGITTYGGLFNSNPFFADPHIIVLDDAHAAENYVASHWSIEIQGWKEEHKSLFAAVVGCLRPLLVSADRSKLDDSSNDDASRWVDLIPIVKLYPHLAEFRAVMDEHVGSSDLRYRWPLIRDSLEGCLFYCSARSVLIRPLVPPTSSHAPFANAVQRIYMSATLGAGGDLERVTGRRRIDRVPVPAGWDKQGTGRRFFVFPQAAIEEEQAADCVHKIIRASGRSLYLVPDDRRASLVSKSLSESIGIKTVNAKEIEDSKVPFVSERNAVAVVANRYDGIDFVDDECRNLIIDGLPKGANLQERFLTSRLGAWALLDDRVLTRVVQGFGRCTRSATDYSLVVVLGDDLQRYLLKKEKRAFMHPELQAELEFGLDQAKEGTAATIAQQVAHFRAQDVDWQAADSAIVELRDNMVQKPLECADDLLETVRDEVDYQESMMHGDYLGALECCRSILGKLGHPELRGYRALWMYLAGSAAWLARESGHSKADLGASDYFEHARNAAVGIRWLAEISGDKGSLAMSADHDAKDLAVVERFESRLTSLGTVHNRKYDKVEKEILDAILQNTDGKLFEKGQEKLGWLLGYDAGNEETDASPDPWWIADGTLCFVFEDTAEALPKTVISPTRARQVSSHPNWIREHISLPDDATILPVLVTASTKANAGALPHLRGVFLWPLDDFRAWAVESLKVARELRREFPGEGNLSWRAVALDRFRATKIAPSKLRELLSKSLAADVLEVSD